MAGSRLPHGDEVDHYRKLALIERNREGEAELYER